jgi:cytochrome c oxidase subunit 3
VSQGTRESRHDPVQEAVGRLGMWVFLLVVSMLFASSVVATLIVRSRAQAWPPPGTPAVVPGLVVSTGLLLLSSGTMAWALHSIRREHKEALRRGLALTLLLGVGFLASQTANWLHLSASHLTMRSHLYGFTFYVLTFLHAAHVVGGLVPLAAVTWRAWRRGYTAERHAGVTYTALYWHFLDVVWLVLFALFVLS